jgi:hypothetical protein
MTDPLSPEERRKKADHASAYFAARFAEIRKAPAPKTISDEKFSRNAAEAKKRLGKLLRTLLSKGRSPVLSRTLQMMPRPRLLRIHTKNRSENVDHRRTRTQHAQNSNSVPPRAPKL